jgi:hypothetical protein
MMHSEWNHGDVDTRAYILVYGTDPVPEQAAFNALKDNEAPRHDEAPGVRTKELVGSDSPLRVNGDIRLFTDSELDAGAVLTVKTARGEGGLVSVRQGGVQIQNDGDVLAPGFTLVMPQSEQPRTLELRATEPARLIRVIHGPGYGFVRETPLPRRRG